MTKDVLIVCIGLMRVLLASAIFFFPVALKAQQGGKQPAPPAAPVVVAAVQKKTVADQLSLVATAAAAATSTVASEVSGRVNRFPVSEGDFVKKGQTLVRLNDEKLVLQRRAAEASLDRIRASLELAERELKRYTRLKDTNSVAERRYDEAFTNYRTLDKDLEKIEAEIALLDYDIAKKEVFAPFSGFVARAHTEVGEWINPGGPVVTLVDLGRIEIMVDVPERYLPFLPKQGTAAVVVKSVSKDPLQGRLESVLPIGDERTRTFPVKVAVKNPGYHIKSGMEAIVRFHLTNQKEALLVPKDAIVPEGNDRIVYRVADGKAAPVRVTVTGYYGGDAAVAGPLKEGDPVVIRGNERLRPGQAVTTSP